MIVRIAVFTDLNECLAVHELKVQPGAAMADGGDYPDREDQQRMLDMLWGSWKEAVRK